jgi:hypothetical protein
MLSDVLAMNSVSAITNASLSQAYVTRVDSTQATWRSSSQHTPAAKLGGTLLATHA